MKKKNLTSRLSLKKITVSPLTDNNAGEIKGGSATCASYTGLSMCGAVCPPQTCQDGGVSFCAVQATENCPTHPACITEPKTFQCAVPA